MEESNVNNLNGVPNFGFGMPEDGIVQAGVTDVPQPLQDLTETNMDNDEKENESPIETDVSADESQAETDNG